MRLFEINEEYMHILQILEDNDGELSDELAQELMIREEDFENKASAYRAIIMKYKSELAAAKLEKDRIAKFEQKIKNAIERLTSSLDDALVLREMDKLDLGEGRMISYRKSTAVLVDEDKLASKWFTRTVKLAPNKKGLKEALNEGKRIRGASLETRQNIQIK